jgi:CRISPR-associated protein Cst2
MNVFGVALTNEVPSSNNRSENDENYSNLQKIQKGGEVWSIITSYAIRSRLREVCAEECLVNRERFFIPDNPQPAVKYKEKINPNKFLDDFGFGYVSTEVSKLSNKEIGLGRKSLIMMNHAVSTRPFESDITLQQYPKQCWGETDPKLKSMEGGLLQNEVHYTSFQFPFAIEKINEWPVDAWVYCVLNAIGNIGFVGGNHSRSLFDFSPKSIIIRVTSKAAFQFDQYGFDANGNFTDIDSIKEMISSFDCADEFWIGGDLANKLSKDDSLKGVHFYKNCSVLLNAIGDLACKNQ